MEREFQITRKALSLRVIRLQRQFAVKLALAFWWPGPISFQDFSKSVSSFSMGPRKRFRASKRATECTRMYNESQGCDFIVCTQYTVNGQSIGHSSVRLRRY